MSSESSESSGIESEQMETLMERGSLRELDRRLRSLAKRRAALDAEEATCLRQAERVHIWREVGCVSMLAYLEDVLGYNPHTAADRLRVAKQLGGLPSLSRALGDGVVSHSPVRDLVRVATEATERAWLDAASGKNLRQIEELVAGHRPGDLPGDPAGPDLRPRVIRLELSPETFALYRETCKVLEDEHGAHLTDDQIIDALCRGAHDGGGERPSHSIAVTICERCDRGWQDGGGRAIEISPAAVELARCDAEHLGSLDAEEPARARADITPSVRRIVKRREHGGCGVPGCRSRRNLALHHIVARADHGGHDPSNLVELCSAHHHYLHAGKLSITGQAPDELVVIWHTKPTPITPATTPTTPALSSPTATTGTPTTPANGPSTPKTYASAPSAPEHSAPEHSAPSRFALVAMYTEARTALVGLGFKPAIAKTAVDAASAHVGRAATLEAWIREALRRCSRS